jgi:sec-independent protein translocase protein TatA
MFGIGPLELFVVAVILLLLFGSRLPSCARALGEGIKNFKKGLSDD